MRDYGIELFLFAVWTLIAVVIASAATFAYAEGVYEYDAIQAGVGEYYLDANHEKRFRFVKPEVK